ncbi:MAG: ABC transporter permease [Gammaproteobacteria bacterium]|nr:ABC transporter permease [Gammaproteobacteria bacterium]
MSLLKLAYRNLWRNKSRSSITLSAITVGLAALIFVWGFIDGMNEQTIENSTTYITGHLKIHKAGFHDDKALYLSMPHDLALQQRINDAPHVVAIAPRVEDKALLSGADEARGVKVIGIDPVLEPSVTTIFKAIKQGRYLQADDGNSIVLGDKLAAKADLKVGDEAVLVTQARDGSLAADRFQVVGLFDSGIDMIDASYVFIPLSAAQELYSLWGQITAWTLRIDNRQMAQDSARQLKNELGAGFDVLDWKQLLPEMVQMIRFHELMSYIVIFIIIVIVAVGVANTILMAVKERTREFGIMLALGTSQLQVIQLVLLESFILGIFGLLLGNVFGLLVTNYFANAGIDLTEFTLAMETMPGLTGSVYPLIRLDRVFFVSIVTLSISVLPALYPAWQVSRLQPVEAIQGVAKNAVHMAWGQTTSARSSTRLVFWRIAFRNIWRNPWRSALTSGATAFGLAAFLFLYAFTDGFFEQMIDNSIDFSIAHVQIEPKGYRDDYSAAYYLSQPDNLLTQVQQNPGVLAASPRIQVEAMISSPTKTEPLILTGVDSDLEPHVTRLDAVIIEGKYLKGNDTTDILLGRKLVDELDLRMGEKIVVTTQLADGSLVSGAYRLFGIYQTGNETFDRMFAYIGLRQAQSLLSMQDRVSTIAIRLQERDLSKITASDLNESMSGTGYEAKSWQDIMPVLVQMIDVTRLMFFVVLAIVFAIVAIGVTNTLIMSVLERTREFGVMLAMGTEPRFIVRMVVYESIVLGFIGIALGTLMGVLLVSYYSEYGVDLSDYSGATSAIPGLTNVVYPMLIFANLWLPTLVLFITGIVAAFYPASRAAQLSPVTALRHA